MKKLALKSFPYLNIYQKFGNVHIFICNCHSDYNISIVWFICKQENLPPPKTSDLHAQQKEKSTSQDLNGRRERRLSVVTVQQLARKTPVCAGESHLKQNSGVAERFEFIHPHWKRLVWSLLSEQSNPTDQSLKWRRKRETDQSVRSGFAYFDDLSQVTCCEPTRLKLRKNPTHKTHNLFFSH